MTKMKFLLALHDKLSGLPKDDVEERLNFYSEMIEDRIEEGLSEEDAVAAVGSVEEVAEQIVAEIPLNKIAKEKIKTQKMKAWEIVLLAVGSPIWVSLLISAFAVVFSLYVSAWAVIISLWAAFGSVAGCAVGGLLGGFVFMFGVSGLSGAAMIAAAFVCAGLSILFYIGCLEITKAFVKLTKIMVLGVKRCFMKKEVAK